MVWDLQPFARERLERARGLLQDSEEHQGSTDLARYVEQVDYTVQLHRILLDDSGLQRQGLSAQDKEQALALLVQVALRALSAPLLLFELDAECEAAMGHTIAELLEGEPGMDRIRHALQMLARVCNMAMLAMRGSHLHAVLQDIALLTGQRQQAARTQLCFEGVEEHTASFDPAVMAADLWRLISLLQLHASHQLIKQGAEGQMLSMLEGTAVGALRQLRGMGADRDAAFLHRRTSDVLSGARKLQQALPDQRAALRLATAEKGHLAIMSSCLSLTTLLMSGAGGPQFSRQEVQDLLAQAQRARRLCKGWIPKVAAEAYKQSLRNQEESLAEAVGLQPGSDMLDAWDDGLELLGETPVPRCWGCGRRSASLRTCSLCHKAAYCSKECQTRHWKEGGHKQACEGRANNP